MDEEKIREIAKDEAWRLTERTPADLYSKIAGSLIKSEQLIEEIWAEGLMDMVIKFHGYKLKEDVKRQIAFLQAFLRAMEGKEG